MQDARTENLLLQHPSALHEWTGDQEWRSHRKAPGWAVIVCDGAMIGCFACDDEKFLSRCVGVGDFDFAGSFN